MARKAFVVMLALAVLMGLSMVAGAQEAKKQRHEKDGRHPDKGKGHLAQGLEELGLTDEQKTKVAEFQAALDAKLTELKAKKGSGAAVEDLKKEHKEALKAFEDQLNSVLTDEQKQKRAEQWKALKAKAHGGEKKGE